VAAVSRPPCIEPKARKGEYFGLETEPTSTRRSRLKFQLSLRVCAKITWHFGISSSHHRRPLLNREILNVDPAAPAGSLNRSRPNLVQI